jgi:hypothetical protein
VTSQITHPFTTNSYHLKCTPELTEETVKAWKTAQTPIQKQAHFRAFSQKQGILSHILGQRIVLRNGGIVKIMDSHQGEMRKR